MKSILLLLMGCILLFVLTIITGKITFAHQYKIRSKTGIQRSEYITIGKIKQYIQIRGQDSSNPVILMLHGGPGNPMAYYSYDWQAELEQDIHSIGFYHNKAKNIIACCQKLLTEFGGEVPSDLDALTSLAGVGRKTANVVRGNWYGIPSIVVDTHVKRVSNLLGLTKNQDPVKIEFDLMKIVPKDKWIDINTQMIAHGRKICIARRPKCAECFLFPYCTGGQALQKKKS